MISTFHRFIFIHIPKTAGNSIQEALMPFSDDKKILISHQDGIDRFGVSGPITPRKHTTLYEYERLLGQEALTRFTKFCVVRNPWDRALSYYLSPHRWMRQSGEFYEQVDPVLDEDAFLESLDAMKPAHFFIRNAAGKVEMDHVIRFETLDQDFQTVHEALDLPVSCLLNHRNRSISTFARDWFYNSEKLLNAVAHRMAEDIERWNYKPRTG